MASLQAKTDAVKAAVASTSTCTPATVVTLKELLIPDLERSVATTKPNLKARGSKAPTGTRAKATTASRNTPTGKHDVVLSSRDRSSLATHVINATIKSLAEAAKPAAPLTPSMRNNDAPRSARRGSLRRSLSTPLSPLQPRTLNRVATSPIITKSAKPLPASQSTGCLATAECAHVAFACLRSIKGPIQADQADYQLENGMTALAGKLLALKLHDHALKELRLLKRRFDAAPAEDASTKAKSNPAPTATTESSPCFADLLEFCATLPKKSISTIANYQIQLLKLVAATKKPSHIEAVLSGLHESHPSSPIRLLTRLANEGGKEGSAAIRQMASLSQILFSLSPSVSSQEDIIAMEPRLSPPPKVAFQLQALALVAQLKWWELAKHQGNVDNDVLSPLARCIRSFARRQNSDDGSIYNIIASSFDDISKLIHSYNLQPSKSSKSPLASIYNLLGSTALSARQYNDAFHWFQKLKDTLTPEDDTSVRICSVTARLFAVALKCSNPKTDIERLAEEVIQGLDGSLSGTVADLNELLESLSLARRSTVGILMNILGPDITPDSVPESLGDLLKTFIRRYPRFVRRWMGMPPVKDTPAKQVLQFEQRRQLVTQSINQILDAALTVMKFDIQSEAAEWPSIDDVLQHCVSLLDSISDPISISRNDQLNIYRIKISSLYFSEFSVLRREHNRSKEANKRLLQALSRSIDCIKECTSAEKEKAQLPMKLEIFANLCKGAGRVDDAVQTLRSICTSMAEDGVLLTVAEALAAQPPALAWAANEKATTLSRTLRSIAKLDRSWNDWTFFLPESERAAVLEHLMHINAENANSFLPPRIHDSSVAALLRIYSLEKYPVRRFRVLLHLFCQNLGEEDAIDEVKGLVEQCLKQLDKKDKADDASLSNYIPHLEAYCASISALLDSRNNASTSAMRAAMSSWKSIIANCRTKDEVYMVIDDPDSLLRHLHSLNQLAGLRGDGQLQVSILELSIMISSAFGACGSDDLIISHSRMASQYVQAGLISKAVVTLNQAKDLVSQFEKAPHRAAAEFYLSQAEYYSSIGKVEDAMGCISKVNEICSNAHASWAQSKAEANLIMAMASFLHSTVSIQTGDLQTALSCIKSSVWMLSHDWSRLETGVSTLQHEVSADISINQSTVSNDTSKDSKNRLTGPRFWNLAAPLIRSLLHISSVYAHVGMFQETIYYADSARKIAESTQSAMFKAQVMAWTGSVYLKAGKLERARSICSDAMDLLPTETCAFRVQFASQLGDIYWELGESEKAIELLQIGEDTAHLLNGQVGDDAAKQVADIDPKAVIAKTKTTARASRMTAAAKAKAPTVARLTRRGQASNPIPTTTPITPQLPKDIYQSSLLAAIFLSRTVGLIHQKDWSSALSTLEKAKDLSKLIGTLSQEQVITATALIGHSMEQMISDPVFSVMQDSTISLPAVSSIPDRASAAGSSHNTSPPRRGRTAASDRKGSKERSLPVFAEALKQAQELLLEAHSSATSTADSNMVHRISALLQNTMIFLSASSTVKSAAAPHSGMATIAVDLARNITWRREQKTMATESHTSAAIELKNSNSASASRRRSSLALTTDMARFQKNYVELVPKNWSVISVSLSDNRHDLCITKFQAGHSPFILRLPLERANSRDADSEVFDFEHGRQELVDIIKLANESSHSARDFNNRGERSAWWAERETLDDRLKDLLVTIETTWLGGFKGIFSQHRHQADLLARFQKNFQQILDGSLPSRNRIRGKKATNTQNVTLDPRILDLFVGLGDPTEPDCDYDEALNDLLYFVVDILQFHGERNAYDEIDFDAMVVETYDALRGYYNAAAKCGLQQEEDAHTVLVLDKALHSFPWESLPCMEGLSVSRVPSLACLRQLIMTADGPATADAGDIEADRRPARQGHYVSANSGTYILNPSSDLKNTQGFFQSSFSSLSSWSSIINKAPQESDFEEALSKSDIMLYFGHGSGAQYVRGKTIRRLEKCKPATFLMGCSSAALTEVGGFESYGPVWNYMMAGCPAVVGTLWDVTDRDIDRFAGRAFEEWGLFAKGTFKETTKGKERERGGQMGEDEGASNDDGATAHLSLAAAVAKAREACRFKYLNAAAVVVYGIPVYIKSNEE